MFRLSLTKYPSLGTGSSGSTTVSAFNGLSLDPTSTISAPIITLGDGTNGSTAKFVSNRFIDANAFSLNILNIGNPSTNAPAIIFKEAVGRVFSIAPFLVFNDSTGVEMSRINFGVKGGIYIGKFAGSADPNSNDIIIGGDNEYQAGANILIGAAAFNQTTNVGYYNIAIGGNSMGGVVTQGNYNIAIGEYAGLAISGDYNINIGAFTTQSGQSSGNTFVGSNTGANNNSAGGRNTFIGCYIQTSLIPNGHITGSGCTVVGAYNGLYTSIGDHVITLGYGNTYSVQPVNSTVIGNLMDCALSNVVYLGTSSQNTIIGSILSGQTDSGVKLQVIGDISTLDPDSGLSGKGWELGDVKTAAVSLDTTRYISVKINGVSYKLLVSA